jgi:hypothetical protein
MMRLEIIGLLSLNQLSNPFDKKCNWENQTRSLNPNFMLTKFFCLFHKSLWKEEEEEEEEEKVFLCEWGKEWGRERGRTGGWQEQQVQLKNGLGGVWCPMAWLSSRWIDLKLWMPWTSVQVLHLHILFLYCDTSFTDISKLELCL